MNSISFLDRIRTFTRVAVLASFLFLPVTVGAHWDCPEGIAAGTGSERDRDYWNNCNWDGDGTGGGDSGNGFGDGNYAPDEHTFPINPPEEDDDDDEEDDD